MDIRRYGDCKSLLEICGHTYIMDKDNAIDFISRIINDTVASNWQVGNFFQDDAEYVSSIKYIPIDVSLFYVNWALSSDRKIYIGKTFTTHNYKYYISTTDTPPYSTIELCQITQSRRFNNFLDFAPYTSFRLQIPYFESIDIDPILVYGRTIKCYVSLDIRTSRFCLYVYSDTVTTSHLIAQKESVIGIDLPLGQTNANEIQRNNILHMISMAGEIGGLAVGVASGNPLVTAGSIGLLTKNTAKAIQDNVTHVTYRGGNATTSQLAVDKKIWWVEECPKNVSIPEPSLKGRIQQRYRSSLIAVTGYTEISQINFDAKNNAIMEDEIDEIVGLLRDGVIL